jgi:transposase
MPSRYDASTRAKAVRLVREHRGDYPSEYAAITAVAGRLGMTAETLRQWIRQELGRLRQGCGCHDGRGAGNPRS